MGGSWVVPRTSPARLACYTRPRRPVAPEARALFVEAASGDPSPSIRAQAAEILGRQQDPALIPVLGGLLGKEPHRDVRERIERAIRELEGRR